MILSRSFSRAASSASNLAGRTPGNAFPSSSSTASMPFALLRTSPAPHFGQAGDADWVELQ